MVISILPIGENSYLRLVTRKRNDFDRQVFENAIELLLCVPAQTGNDDGGGHAAGLNFGDCFTYALAKLRDEPVLFKGNEFAHTDLQIAS